MGFRYKVDGDLIQRMGDHKRVEQFSHNSVIDGFVLVLTFVVFGIVLLIYDKMIFRDFVMGSVLYGVWIAFFLRSVRCWIMNYLEKQAENNNKTYQFITTMQEIKLQDCEQRRRWEWEDVQAGLFHFANA